MASVDNARVRLWVIAIGVGVGLLGGWWLSRPGVSQTATATQFTSTRLQDTWTGKALTAPPGEMADGAQALPVSQLRQRLWTQGRLQGTTASGDWCVVRAQALAPCGALRRRFEYYLLALGMPGISASDIRRLIADEATQAHGPQLAASIMVIFDKYWRLRTYAWQHQLVQSDLGTWMPMLQELKTVRRQILGNDWAEAFFADEELAMQQQYDQLASGQPLPVDPGAPVPAMLPGADPAAVKAERVVRYGEDAAERLAKVDAQWAQWDKRVGAARQEWLRIQASAELSDLQKQDQMNRYVMDHFEGLERVRVSALLGLP